MPEWAGSSERERTMSIQIETLESRTLLSAVPAQLVTDAATLKSDGATLKADLKQWQTNMAKDLKAVTADLKSAKTASNKALLKTLAADDRACVAKLKKDFAFLSKVGKAD